MLTTVSRTPQFRLRSGDSWRDLFDMYRELREYDPVHRVVNSPDGDDPGEYWVLTRHADVHGCGRCDDLLVGTGPDRHLRELEAIGMADNPPLVMQDPPVHTRFRKLVASGLHTPAGRRRRARVREFVVARLDEMADGAADIVGQLFKPLPSMVVAHYLGVPESDWSRFDGWTQAIVGANAAGGLAAVTAGGGSEASGSDQISAGDATAEMLGYFSELITFRRDHPGDDTVSALVESGRAEDPAGLLSILAFAFTMVAGATTRRPACSAAASNSSRPIPTSGASSSTIRA